MPVLAPSARPAPILPPRLDALLATLQTPSRRPVVIRGWRSECALNDHDFGLWIVGTLVTPVWPGVPPIARELHLLVCAFCETVEVRDVTVDVLPGLSTGGRPARRRNALLGWYSGARANRRVYT